MLSTECFSCMQVVERIIWWVQSVKGPTKCLCYCLTKSSCRKIARLLNDRGVTATPVTSDENPVLAEVLQSFRNRRISVLCCTGVLGRGFHVDDIRFVFHASVPLDLTDYIQQTGRAGRDGKQARCILFFRAQDFETVRNIKINPLVPDFIRESVVTDIAEVASYATSSKCRYSELASSATIEQCMPSHQRCTQTAPCDNCVVMGLQTTDIGQRPVFDSICDHAVCDFRADSTLPSLTKTALFSHVNEPLTSPDASFRVEGKKQDGEYEFLSSFDDKCSKESRTQVIDFEKSHEYELCGNAIVAATSIDPLDRLQVPFLVRFEAER